jgi:hypothetical protein
MMDDRLRLPLPERHVERLPLKQVRG